MNVMISHGESPRSESWAIGTSGGHAGRGMGSNGEVLA